MSLLKKLDNYTRVNEVYNKRIAVGLQADEMNAEQRSNAYSILTEAERKCKKNSSIVLGSTIGVGIAVGAASTVATGIAACTAATLIAAPFLMRKNNSIDIDAYDKIIDMDKVSNSILIS